VADPVDTLCYSGLVLQLLERIRRDATARTSCLPEARALVDEMRERLRPSHQIEWIDANVLLTEGCWSEALPRFQALAAIDADTVGDPVLAFERDIFGAGAFHGIGVCLFELGRPDEAACWFAKAERERPGVPEFRAKRLVAERLAGTVA
jgi:hypothetical protein